MAIDQRANLIVCAIHDGSGPAEPVVSAERNRLGGYFLPESLVAEEPLRLRPSPHGGSMRTPLWLVISLGLTVIACRGRGTGGNHDTAQVRQPADSAATASRSPGPAPTGASSSGAPASTTTGTAGITPSEPGTIPAKPTPTVTTESSIATMRLSMQRLDSASVTELQAKMKDHSKMLGDLLTTMRVEVQAVTSPSKNGWLASADSVWGSFVISSETG